jgi:hypothetical protein
MKVVSNTLIAISALCSVPFANAGELNLTLGSFHFKDNRSHNNVNPGIGYTFDSSVVDWLFGWEHTGHDTIGVYYNSGNKMSLYYGYYLPLSLPADWKKDSEFLRDVRVGAMFGVASGYGNSIGIIPAVLLIGSYPIGKLWGDSRWSARLSLVPAPGGVVTLSLGYHFN